MTRPQFTEQDVHLALDGEMPNEDRGAFDAWLDGNPEMKTRSQRFAVDREGLRQALAPIAAEPVPPRLQQVLGGQVRISRQWLSWRQLAAAGLIFALGAAGGYGVAVRQQPATAEDRTFVDNAIRAHVTYAAEKLHVVEVKADQRDHMLSWLSKRVGVDVVAPDLSGQGYQLIGGRLLPDSDKPAAQFMYENGSGDRVSLYITREQHRAETGFKSTVEDGTRALYWMDDEYACAVAGVAPEKTLLAIADTAYRQYLSTEAH